MVVASFVTTNESGDKLTLRSTTVMPNLPGLPALVCLMFAPMVELRSNDSLTKLSGALCGLGRDPETGHSLFAENDIELIFDVELNLNDIAHINKIRYWLNRAACVTEKTPDEEAEEIQTCRDKLIDYISQLVFLLKFVIVASKIILLYEISSSLANSTLARQKGYFQKVIEIIRDLEAFISMIGRLR